MLLKCHACSLTQYLVSDASLHANGAIEGSVCHFVLYPAVCSALGAVCTLQIAACIEDTLETLGG